MSKKDVIIVESPSKIKTLQKFLGDEYIIEASVGHIRDLPKKNLGLDIDDDFKTTYEISPDSIKTVKKLKDSLKNANNLYLATDPDREGEAISWHIIDELKPKIPIKRLVFNEITKSAIKNALKDTRKLDMNLVDAQECRRILDRLFGFLISKKLWTNIKGGLSAGRVQSPAVKILVDREKERTQFIKNEYWSLDGEFKTKNENITSNMISIKNKKVASGSDFNKKTGQVKGKNIVVLNQNDAEKLSQNLKNNNWTVASVIKKPATQNPYPPFITSTLQQEGIRKLYLSSQQVMMIAQKLYENGHITYMRTDSVNLSNEAINASRKEIKKLYGTEFIPDKPRVYKSKAKNIQEAHEAIRPAGSSFKHPDTLKSTLSDQEYKLYNMIWKRTIASQMKAAKLEKTTVQISDKEHVFEARGKVIIFPGFLKAYVESSDHSSATLDNMEQILPEVKVGESLKCNTIIPKQHFTKPIGRFTEASLVKELETLGIGRPSTYAAIMKKIQDKAYVRKIKGAMIPTFTGYAIVQFLEKYFDELVDLQYTSNMENDLDNISIGNLSRKKYLNDFYFDTANSKGLEKKLNQEFDKNISRLISTFGDNVELKIGRYGIYVEKNGQRATVYDEIAPSDLNLEKINEILDKKNEPQPSLGKFPGTDNDVFLKKGRYGAYIQMEKKMKSLPPNLTENDINLENAIKIISLPKNLGKMENTEDNILADIGRYGPYVKSGKISRSIPKDKDVLTLTLEEAVELLSSQKSSGPAILKELGKDDNKNDIIIKDGRYGKFITNGKVNAPMPKNTEVDEMKLEKAIEILSKRKPKKYKFKKR